jgi:hypothetical protein
MSVYKRKIYFKWWLIFNYIINRQLIYCSPINFLGLIWYAT